MLKQRKEEIVSSLTAEFGGVTQMIVADPTGLSVAEMKELRNRLRPSGAEFRVAKNTLARIAAREAGREELVALLVGPTAITLVPGDPGGRGQDAVRLRSHVAQARTARRVPRRRGVRRRQRQAARDAAVARTAAGATSSPA